jgi:hypothetical protein
MLDEFRIVLLRTWAGKRQGSLRRVPVRQLLLDTAAGFLGRLGSPDLDQQLTSRLGINSNSSNDDNDVPACIAVAVHNNRHTARYSKLGAERNRQVAHKRGLR